MIRKLLRLVALVPEAFVTLTFSLAVSIILLYLVAFFKIHEVVYSNCPWAVAAFIGVHLIYNDIWVLEGLKKTIDEIPINKFADLLKLMDKFIKELTTMEKTVLKLHFIENLPNGEIAKSLHIEEATVRTHTNNINRKWTPFKADIKGRADIRELRELIFRLHELNLIKV